LCYEPQLTLSFPVSNEGPDLFTTYELGTARGSMSFGGAGAGGGVGLLGL